MTERTIDIGMRKIREALEETEAQLEKGYENARRMDAEAFAEFRRYREREPLVREMLDAWNLWTGQEMYGELIRDGMVPSDFEAWESTVDAVRAFVLQPADAPVDSETNHGDKPGAVSDDTSQVADSTGTSHLSSVVEQRFRKPSVSPESEQASEQPPGNAREEVDHALERIEGRRDPNGVAIEEDAELVATELRRLRELVKFRERECAVETEEKSRSWKEASALLAKLARVEALLELEHDDSTVRVSRLRAALKGES